MNRRWLLVLLSAFLVLGAACGDSGETEAGGDPEQPESETPETEESETPTDGAVTIKAIDFAF